MKRQSKQKAMQNDQIIRAERGTSLRFLMIGDVVGRPGREAVRALLPGLKKEFLPDHVIINVENMAHGAGISPDTMREALAWEADTYTTGDHAWDNERGNEVLENQNIPIVRPANYPAGVPGRGYHVFSSGAWRVAVINLQGQVFFKNHPYNPFFALDDLLRSKDIADAHIVFVDLQAEATSEKKAFGWYADGRVAAVIGTHTHVPTADAQILPQGTGYITDIGMTGSHHSVIGADRDSAVKHFTTQLKIKRTYDDAGPSELGGVVVDVDPQTGKAEHIEGVWRTT